MAKHTTTTTTTTGKGKRVPVPNAKPQAPAKQAPAAATVAPASPSTAAALGNAPLGQPPASVAPQASPAPRYLALAGVAALAGDVALAVLYSGGNPKRGNPKPGQPRSASQQAWLLYAGCATVGAYRAAVQAYVASGAMPLLGHCTNANANLAWDAAHGLVALGGAAPRTLPSK